jgi:elongation factor 2
MCTLAGKTTLTDCLLAACGRIAPESAGDVRATDTRDDEAERGFSIKATAVSLCCDYDTRYLVNLVDCPGHVDFSGEVTAALRVSDGALLVVDCVQGVREQTKTILRELMSKRVKPVLVLNKIDRLLLEKNVRSSVRFQYFPLFRDCSLASHSCSHAQLNGEEMYQALLRVVEEVNEIIATNEDDALGYCELSPATGTVAFAAGLYHRHLHH